MSIEQRCGEAKKLAEAIVLDDAEQVMYKRIKCVGGSIKLMSHFPNTAREIAVVYNIDVKPGTLFYDTKQEMLICKRKIDRGSADEYYYLKSPRVTIYYKDGGSQSIKISYILKYIKKNDDETL